MRDIISIAAGIWIGLAGTVMAQSTAENPVVVELYTSQGCSSCPPADKVLQGLAKRDDVIALALHVDYWDYIGWKDSFADPGYSDRQRAYARFAGARTVYTPQMIVGGMDHLVGVRTAELEALVKRHGAADTPVRITLQRQGGKVRINAQSKAALPDDCLVQLVRYRPLEQVTIERGENAGKVLDYANIVTDWRRIAKWNGRSPLAVTADAAGSDALAVIIQEPGPGRILAAARLQ
ncbi:MAG: DUF1223 domain-containing protein [Rhodobacteraceae bacterium]|nr:DUF1223 domain-containing protein [Paracoccaceae bacterium]